MGLRKSLPWGFGMGPKCCFHPLRFEMGPKSGNLWVKRCSVSGQWFTLDPLHEIDELGKLNDLGFDLLYIDQL